MAARPARVKSGPESVDTSHLWKLRPSCGPLRCPGSGRRFSSPAWPLSRSPTSGTSRPAGRGCTRPGCTKVSSCSPRSAVLRARLSSAPSARPGSSSARRCSPRPSATSSSTSGTAAIHRSRHPPTSRISSSTRSSTSGSCSYCADASRPSARPSGSTASSRRPRRQRSAPRCSSRSSSSPRTAAGSSS